MMCRAEAGGADRWRLCGGSDPERLRHRLLGGAQATEDKRSGAWKCLITIIQI